MITLTNLCIRNKKQAEVVFNNLNLVIKPSSFIAVIGKSGVGKTTFLNALMHQVEVLKGNIIYKDINLYSTTKKQLNNYLKKLFYLSVNNNLINEISVFDNLRISYKKYQNGFFKFINYLNKNQIDEIYKYVELFDLTNYLFSLVSELSKGQKQRVSLIKLFLTEADLYLLDEPTANLDLVNAKKVLTNLKDLTINTNKIVLINLHDVGLLKQCFEDVLIFKNKEVAYFGKVKDLNEKQLLTYYE